MDVILIKPERKAQLEEHAQRHGRDPATALDVVLADALESKRDDYNETVTAVMQAYESVKAGRTRPAEGFSKNCA